MTLATRTGRRFGNDSLDQVAREVDGALGLLLNGRPAGTAQFPVDVREDVNSVYVEADLPGFGKEDIEITVEDQVLTIAGERKTPEPAADAPKSEWRLNERRATRFQRSFTLPPTVSEQDVNAKLENGVLTVTLKKREESKPRKIVVL
jgi:HSP20 family protein